MVTGDGDIQTQQLIDPPVIRLDSSLFRVKDLFFYFKVRNWFACSLRGAPSWKLVPSGPSWMLVPIALQ